MYLMMESLDLCIIRKVEKLNYLECMTFLLLCCLVLLLYLLLTKEDRKDIDKLIC